MLRITKIPLFIENILPRFSSIFNKAQLSHFAEYLTGLIVSKNKTVLAINNSFIEHRDQSTKNHFLTSANWDEDKFNEERLSIIKETCQKHHIGEGLLIIDDTGIHKSGRKIEGANWFWDHAKHSHSFGHQLVTSQYVTKKFHVPLHYRLYRREGDVDAQAFKSKLDLALELIMSAVRFGIAFSCVMGDSWYFSVKIIKYLESIAKNWIFASKSNRKIYFKDRWLQLKAYLKTLKAEDFKQVNITKTNGKKLTVWAFSKTVQMSKVGRVKIVISFLHAPLKGNPFFLVTNRKEWTIGKILSTYAKRWPIETFYRDAKQNLGLESSEMRLLQGIRRHWDLVFLAYTLLQIESLSGPLTKWLKSNVVTIGGKCRLVSSEILRSFIFWVYEHAHQNYEPDTLFKMTMQYGKQLEFKFS